MNDFLHSLAAWAAGLELAVIPDAVRQRALASLIDTLGVGLAGAGLPATVQVRDWALGEWRAGPAELLGSGECLGVAGAALVNGVACHALDFDDTCYDGIVHASAVVLPAALAQAQVLGASGERLLLAYCVGCQVEIELGRALGNALYARGWFNTALLGGFGAAAAAGRLLGLDAAGMHRALALASVQARGIRAVLGSEAKAYLAGRAAETGVRCAAQAQRGLSAPARPLSGPDGFAATHLGHDVPLPSFAGPRWAFVDPGFALKRYPLCSATQAAAEALAELALDARRVLAIEVRATALVLRSLPYAQPQSAQQAQFSMPFALACILRFGDIGPQHLRPSVFADEAHRRLMARVELALDEALEGRPDRLQACPEGARLRVRLDDGQVLETQCLAATGMPQRPFSEARLWHKFRLCGRFAGLPDEATRALFERLGQLETLPTSNFLPSIRSPHP
ncbi:MmgE/PrpD family protein [Stutzerimonas kirkiae]|uniref:MmgE/PrpD family protein n=1 Tax=Stutzerimonas kirkiae TaxID=2211392 RepID=A0A4Q9QZJ1_9GAMM|nr:MmgE/PrpD family protein [Stutzerimonas kirkiae]TBU90053.1 MmgE/PrpD family protein [Stutzerimonas kirkiae]TBU98210.1 MmgE/PrpD family protein [Stutzerimonas kirkiae]TBV10178.1 MmgE/PrpD family protein [Stutzerimonas kirkiae]